MTACACCSYVAGLTLLEQKSRAEHAKKERAIPQHLNPARRKQWKQDLILESDMNRCAHDIKGPFCCWTCLSSLGLPCVLRRTTSLPQCPHLFVEKIVYLSQRCRMEALCAQLSAHRKQPAHANCRHNKGKKAKTKVKSASKSGSKHGEESSSRSNSRVHGSALLRPNSVSAAGASDAIPRWLVTLHCLAVSRYLHACRRQRLFVHVVRHKSAFERSNGVKSFQ